MGEASDPQSDLQPGLQIREVSSFDAPLFAGFTFPLYRDRLLLGSWRQKILALGAWQGSRPVGLALFEKTTPSTAVLRSVWVESDCRRRGMGLELLQNAAAALAEQGVRRVEAIHRSTLEDRVAFESLLKRAGWTRPEMRMMVLESTFEGMLRSRTIRRTTIH